MSFDLELIKVLYENGFLWYILGTALALLLIVPIWLYGLIQKRNKKQYEKENVNVVNVAPYVTKKITLDELVWCLMGLISGLILGLTIALMIKCAINL